MIVTAVWKDSDYLNKEWSNRRVTSYWVHAERIELDQVLPYVDDSEDFLEDIDIHTTHEQEPFYMLVAKDLSSVVIMPRTYPDSGQWNGRSPFEEMTPTEIESLADLQTLEN